MADGLDDNLTTIELVRQFTAPLCSRDERDREYALAGIEKSMEDFLARLHSDDNSPELMELRMEESGDIVLVERTSAHKASLFCVYLPVIQRLTVSCPFFDVRERFLRILAKLKEKGLKLPEQNASDFISNEDLAALGSCKEGASSTDILTHTLFIEAFLQQNRLDHVTQVMGYHPEYLEIFFKTQNYILRGDGPLPYDYRHFIAIMAAGRHQCSYLINLQKQEFLQQGGDPSWLKGLQAIPQKLRDLYDINKILAHRPWLINRNHITKLTRGGQDPWSLAEVVHAIVILTHFHALSSFVFGCGVNEEVDVEAGRRFFTDGLDALKQGRNIWSTSTLNSDVSWNTSPTDTEVDLETLMERMKSLSQKSEECSQEEAVKRFETIETQSAELNGTSSSRLPTHVKADVGQFVEDPSFLYQDFAKRGVHDIATFRVQDYSWEDQGYSLVNSLYNDVGNLLDDKFKTAYYLTYNTMGGRRGVDTTRFRMAVWNYIQCMFGIRHDDYDYGEVNQLLERSLKAFIKQTCCYPESVSKKDYDRVLREFQHSEKVHVNLMILEARMQAELLYALRAVMNYNMS